MNNNSFFSYPESETQEQATATDTDELVFLQNSNDEDWEKLLSYTETLYFHIGDIIINVGEADRGLYFVVNGQLEVLALQPSQHWFRVAELDKQAIFGEQAFVDGKPRSALVRATSDGVLLRLSYENFEVLAAHESLLARQILFDLARILSVRLRQTSAALANYTSQN